MSPELRVIVALALATLLLALLGAGIFVLARGQMAPEAPPAATAPASSAATSASASASASANATAGPEEK